MAWSLHILGTNAAVPTLHRNPSAQALDTEHEIFLIDCGEATQNRLAEFRIRRSRIHHIFVSHLHGDHIFGLPGLITSYNLFGRKDPLFLYGPIGLKGFIDTIIEATGLQLQYPLQIKEHDDQISRKILETDHVYVYTIPLDHRIPTTGYLFREKVFKRKINLEMVSLLGVPYHQMKDLQNGKDWQRPDGRLIENEEMTFPGRDPVTFAYCSDTRYSKKIIPLVRNVNLLYHEATFANDLAQEAHNRGHSTALEAARIAKTANVGKLIIGHFSARYQDPLPLLTEAQAWFPDTLLAVEGKIVSIESRDSSHIE